MSRQLVITDPATGLEVGRVPVTPVREIPGIVANASTAEMVVSTTERAGEASAR